MSEKLNIDDHKMWCDLDCIIGLWQGYHDCVSGRIVEMSDDFWVQVDTLVTQDYGKE